MVKISNPTKKEARGGAMQEGREIFCKNLDFKVSEKDIRETFSKFGMVENLAIPQNVDGRRRGYFFVTFSSKVRILVFFHIQPDQPNHLHRRKRMLHWQ